MLREVNAFDTGFDRAQRSAVFDGSKHLGIKRFLGRNTAGKKDVNDRLRGGFGTCGLGLKLKKVSEGEADTANQADEKEFATIWPPNVFVAVAEAGNIVCHTKRR